MFFAVVVPLILTMSASAGNLDGTYKFKSRVKEGKPDLVSWTGTMKVAGDIMNKELKSPDGKEVKTYESNCKTKGANLYNCTFTKAYKAEYVGKAYDNNIVLNGNELKIKSPDGSFEEVWMK